MSAKELGMLHTVNFGSRIDQSTATVTYNHDLSGQLTEQLQRMVRQGNYFKIAGIDIGLAVSDASPTDEMTVSVSGVLRYMAPTRGRCAAYRGAFKAMAEAMKVQGITMRDNKFYDFRVPLRESSAYDNVTPFANGATFNGVDELAILKTAPNGVFSVHNESVQPVQTSATFSEGFGVFGNAGNDFVLNESQQGYRGNHMIADTEFEEIPFQLAYDSSNTTSGTLTWSWRPDPALYLAIAFGQFEMEIQDSNITSPDANPQAQLWITYSVAGWKSIMGSPDKKKRRSRRSNGNKSNSKSSTTTTVTTVKK